MTFEKPPIIIQLENLKKTIESYDFRYLTIESKYSIHHIEKLMPTLKDRGRYKWIAEMKMEGHCNMIDEEAQRSHIDNADCFPRYMFHADSLVAEVTGWFTARRLMITEIKIPTL